MFSNSFWRIVLLTAAGTIGTASQASAALYYWPDSDSGFSQAPPPVQPVRQKPRHRQGKKIEAPTKEAVKPRGPLIIAISIERQNLKVYDANGFFAETPVSTGMHGHPTPMGVFSVIQKHKFHRSNIYSGAPMPYMQRITWSGVAMHAGVLPGYPASHGCIRMPMAFAVKMWGWTRMGARVVVTPDEMTPASFSHPLLAMQKLAPRPVSANEPQAEAPPAVTIDKTAGVGVAIESGIAATSFELRSTVGHDDGATPLMEEPPASTALRDKTHTADAGSLSPNKATLSQSDVAPPAGNTPSRQDIDEASIADAKSATAKSETEPATAKDAGITPAGDKPVQVQPAGNVAAEIKAPEIDASESIKAAEDANTSVPDVKKDQTYFPGDEKAAASTADPPAIAAPKHAGQISVLISRKDSKLYVRQNFAPLFDAPVTIAPSDRPFGTHVFTAQVDKDNANLVHWSVISLPVAVRYSERRDEDERVFRKRKMTGAAEMRPLPMPDNPTEALDRISIPADTMARIAEALTTGSSIIVSDQGIAAGETGEGTDFIVSLR
jgi:lipoprotein-anchoring transpeptidase ErfK/SrfK